jgi:hypothetical protein
MFRHYTTLLGVVAAAGDRQMRAEQGHGVLPGAEGRKSDYLRPGDPVQAERDNAP